MFITNVEPDAFKNASNRALSTVINAAAATKGSAAPGSDPFALVSTAASYLTHYANIRLRWACRDRLSTISRRNPSLGLSVRRSPAHSGMPAMKLRKADSAESSSSKC
ncbi:hypothetical protein SAMN04489740_4236 [Arthrobacter alpinus]|uniref:Uncharacterized protein n=1 Tax=Arthrobacter alpinus TaxID=656366 RepID=A0A1H5PEW5_9MICC|nr:hypothetical protein SAMN04489740_4236 [Arthrobacter alpinus]